MWISKDAEVRRQELLQAAIALFEEKGFHQTSINDVISRVGVTKGAFYYYFRSMDDVMESIALSRAEKMVETARRYADRVDLDALSKVQGLIREAIAGYRMRRSSRPISVELLHGEENAKLSYRIHQRVTAAAVPILRAVIQQGMDEGVFRLQSADDAANLYMQLTSLFKDAVSRVPTSGDGEASWHQIVARKLAYYSRVLEASLGLQPGALTTAFGLDQDIGSAATGK